jgi:multidrug transporter EmrE-like cation transporter
MSGLGTTLILVVLLRIQAVFVVSTSTLALRSSAFSRWLSYLGYGIALVMFFMPILTEPVGLAFPIWVGILSTVLLLRKGDIIPESDGM